MGHLDREDLLLVPLGHVGKHLVLSKVERHALDQLLVLRQPGADLKKSITHGDLMVRKAETMKSKQVIYS